jgi:hypothetical protein
MAFIWNRSKKKSMASSAAQRANEQKEGIMNRNTYLVVAAAVALGLAASGCTSPTNSATTTSSLASASPASVSAAATQLQSLIPTPANTQRTDGPDAMPDNGITLHFLVNGSSTGVMDTYKTALQGKGWTVTVVASGGWKGSGGATYTATQGDTYGVFTGGGNEADADVHACVWPSKPANPNCGSGNR